VNQSGSDAEDVRRSKSDKLFRIDKILFLLMGVDNLG
jgi:hypothetical protein